MKLLPIGGNYLFCVAVFKPGRFNVTLINTDNG